MSRELIYTLDRGSFLTIDRKYYKYIEWSSILVWNKAVSVGAIQGWWFVNYDYLKIIDWLLDNPIIIPNGLLINPSVKQIRKFLEIINENNIIAFAVDSPGLSFEMYYDEIRGL